VIDDSGPGGGIGRLGRVGCVCGQSLRSLGRLPAPTDGPHAMAAAQQLPDNSAADSAGRAEHHVQRTVRLHHPTASRPVAHLLRSNSITLPSATPTFNRPTTAVVPISSYHAGMEHQPLMGTAATRRHRCDKQLLRAAPRPRLGGRLRGDRRECALSPSRRRMTACEQAIPATVTARDR